MQELIKRGIQLLVLIAPFCRAEERPIVVLIPSFNNAAWYKKNIESVVKQKYNNYRVIYINDCSTDGTGELVSQYLAELGAEYLVTVINNTSRIGALANLYKTIHMLPNHAIVLTLDGDDCLAHDGVLSRINEAYGLGVWLTYGQFKTYPQDTVGFCREMPQGVIYNNLYREYEWITSHPRTFYAGLFKKIQLKDFLYEGNFFDVTWDMAFMYPMLEMAVERIAFIPDVLYIYNQNNTLNDFRNKTARQIRCKYYIASKNKYTRLSSLQVDSQRTVGMIIFSHNRPYQLEKCLASLDHYAIGIQDIMVVYCCDEGTEDSHGYATLEKKYEKIRFRRLDHDIDLRTLLVWQQCSYVLITDDSVELCAPCKVDTCVQALKQTHGHAFYLSLNADQVVGEIPLISLPDGVKAWQFKHGSYAFKKPFNGQMTLYSRDMLQSFLNRVSGCTEVTSLNDLAMDYEQVGLCFDHAKVKRIVS